MFKSISFKLRPKLRIKNIYFYLQGIPRTGRRQKVSCYLISESKNKIKLKIGNDPEFNTGERLLDFSNV